MKDCNVSLLKFSKGSIDDFLNLEENRDKTFPLLKINNIKSLTCLNHNQLKINYHLSVIIDNLYILKYNYIIVNFGYDYPCCSSNNIIELGLSWEFLQEDFDDCATEDEIIAKIESQIKLEDNLNLLRNWINKINFKIEGHNIKVADKKQAQDLFVKRFGFLNEKSIFVNY